MKDEIIQFLKENIIGKNLFTDDVVTDDVVYQLDNGKLEGVYSDKIVFSDLAKTENGFSFNMTTVTHELIYNMNGKGSRMTIAKDYTGTSVFRYELAMRKSTNQMTGYMRCISTTLNNSPKSDDGSRGLRNIRCEL